MKGALLLLLVTLITCLSCSKKVTSIPYSGNWTGSYYAAGFSYGTWTITIDDNGGITGKIISAPGFPPFETYVIGNVNSSGSISFTATISSTIQWVFEGTLVNTVANGTWIANSLPGNPPNKIWDGTKQ